MFYLPLVHQGWRHLISTHVHPADLSKRLARLVSLGLLEPSGRGRGTKYRLPTASSTTANGQMADLNAANGRPQGQMADLGGSTSLFPEIVRKVATDRKSTQQEMWDAILSLCGDTWRTSTDIAAILDRGVRTIRRHCDALVFSRKLAPKYPESPHHPRQAYRAVSASAPPNAD